MPAKSAALGLSPGRMRAAVAALPASGRVSLAFGALRFVDGVPATDTVDARRDALDLIRGVEVFLNCPPGASLAAVRRGLRPIGGSSPAEGGDSGAALPDGLSFAGLAIRLVCAVGVRPAAGGAACGS